MEHGGPVLFNTPHGIICAQQVGAPSGLPVFHFHGQLSSRLETLYFHQAAADLDIRLIGLDRQGFGNSPYSATAGLASWPSTVISIADQLGIERFGVMGASAGAKYVLAMVLEVPERITAAALVSAFGQIEAPNSLESAAFRVKLAIHLYRHAPWFGDIVSAATGLILRNSADSLLRLGSYLAPPTERLILADKSTRKIAADVLRCSASQGARGIAQEFRFLIAPWKLALDQICVPVALWHGESDVISPVEMAEALSASIPGSRLHRVPNAGHVSLLVNHPREILASFLRPEMLSPEMIDH